MKAGDSLKPALYNLCSIAWRSEKLPTGWSTSSLVQLYKGSGQQNELRNYRFINMKDDFQKFFGHIVLSQAKDKLMSNIVLRLRSDDILTLAAATRGGAYFNFWCATLEVPKSFR